MLPRTLQSLVFILVSIAVVSASPAPLPVPIDANTAHVIAENNNIGCQGPKGCLAAQGPNGTQNAAAILAKSGTPSVLPGSTAALAAAAAVAGSLSIAGLL